MSKVILYIASSVDGFIATPDGSVDWLNPYNDSGEDYGYEAFVSSMTTIVMGNTTYKQVLDFGEWPYASLTSYVFTHHKRVDNNVHFVSGDVEEFVNELPANAQVWLMGGAHLVNEFLKKGLIDEIILFVMPILLGSGIRLFFDDNTASALTLQRKKTFDSGVVELHYAVK